MKGQKKHKRESNPCVNILNPKELIKYPTRIFVPSEQRESRDPSANLLIHKDLTSY